MLLDQPCNSKGTHTWDRLLNNSISGNQSSVPAALDIVGDQWMMLILRELFLGSSKWREFTDKLSIAPSTLNKRLKQLIDANCLFKELNGSARGAKYCLTESGQDLFLFLIVGREWQLKWDIREEVFISPWVHKCENPLRVDSRCGECNQNIHISDIAYQSGPESKHVPEITTRHFRIAKADAFDHRSGSGRLAKIIQVLGDRRSSQIIAEFYFGCHKFDDIQKTTGLHPGIVSDRLRKLQLQGICHTRLYQENPDRYYYMLSASGHALYTVILQLLHWADKWIYGVGNEPIILTHTLCDKHLHAVVKCQHCNEIVNYDDVKINHA